MADSSVLIGLPKILHFPEFRIKRNNRLALESGVVKMIRKVRPGKFFPSKLIANSLNFSTSGALLEWVNGCKCTNSNRF